MSAVRTNSVSGILLMIVFIPVLVLRRILRHPASLLLIWNALIIIFLFRFPDKQAKAVELTTVRAETTRKKLTQAPVMAAALAQAAVVEEAVVSARLPRCICLTPHLRERRGLSLPA